MSQAKACLNHINIGFSWVIINQVENKPYQCSGCYQLYNTAKENNLKLEKEVKIDR